MDPSRTRRVLIASLIAVGATAAFIAVPQLRDAVPATAASWTRVILWFGGLSVVGLAAWRFVRPKWLAGIVAAAPLVGFSVWALAPAFYDRTVNEAFPVVAAGAETGVSAPDEAGPTIVTVAPATSPTTTVAPATTVVAVIAPTTTATTTATTTTPTPTTTTPATTTTTTTTATTSPPSTDPVLLGSGSLRGLAGHDASGQVALYRLADGSHLLRFENLDVERAPDLHVYLVPGARQTDTGGAVRLAKLKGNKGNQNYTIPSGVDVGDFDGVLIWCKKFTVEVAGTALA